MRVIGGEFRSRALKSLPGLGVRPTPDRLREALFNILAPKIEGKIFADLYAGTGAVGIEALSRGAATAIFVEQKHAAVRVIHDNLKVLGLQERAKVYEGRVTAVVPRLQAGIVFLDPPYPLDKEYAAALTLLADRAPELVIAQHPPRVKLEEAYGMLHRVRVLKQGDNELSFYKP
jgi:16S rRNA (guanine(966)-N(2))-methyltransferase RsmD